MKNFSHNNSLYLSFFLAILLTFPSLSSAQPWLSNRFAQNCAGCHSPGRFNREFSERRCTLACQGCHVSPNGGGMRNFYGKWTQERWLRSFYISGLLTNRKTPAPIESQNFYDKKVASQLKPRQSLTNVKSLDRRPLLVSTEAMSPNESLYDRRHEIFDYTEVGSKTYQSYIPAEDPYYLERLFPVTGGADFRYFILDRLNNIPTSTKSFRAFPMAADLYLRFKPIRENLSLVTEARFLNGPNNSQLEKFFTSEARIRSAYILSDNLPFNSYMMAGLYRPLFGYYTPDHTTLAQTIAGFSTRSLFLAASVGTSPNVPFANFHLIQPVSGGPDTRGFAANLGGRFVSLGASFMFSYWKTQTRTGGVDLTHSMYSATGGLQLGPVTANIDLLHVNQEFAPGLGNGGDVFTVDTQTRLIRENYLLASWAHSNVARSLIAGDGSEWMVGFKSYLIAGADLELLYIQKSDTISGLTTKTQDIQFQIHLFY